MMNQLQMNFDENLTRVKSNLAAPIREFVAKVGHREFHMTDLHEYVSKACQCAPASVDRIFREMRRAGELNYEVLNRRQSLYRITMTA